jgi:crotonobetainyl-CoA:carnitine CoA-transferase CaiB-like acyl-CoA transferase
MTSTTSDRGPLQGIRVIDFSTVYAGPISAMLLGDYGADVLKVELPIGDPARTHGWSVQGPDGVQHGLWWKVIARNKEAMTLDVRTPEGREILLRLVAEADVMTENFRPGVLEGWGLGPDELHAVNPRLVLLRTTGFGQDGPYARRRAFGSLAEAMTGFAHLTGQPDGPPTLPPFGLADGVAGVTGAFAVLTALRARDRDGRGQVIDLSLFEPLLGLMGPTPSAYDQLGVVPTRQGNRSRNSAPRNTYLTRDGHWVAVSSAATSVAARVMRLVGRGELADEPWFASAHERVAHVDELDGAVQAWIAERDLDTVVAAFEEVGAALFPVYDVAQLFADPQVRARDAVTTVDDEDLGPLRMQNVWFRLSETPGGIRFGGRRLGQDTDTVLAERLGYTAEQIAALRKDGVV